MNLRLDPELLSAVPADQNVIVWEKYNVSDLKQASKFDGASGKPLAIPVSRFNPDGSIRIVVDKSKVNTVEQGVFYTDDVNNFLQPNATDPVVGGTIVDVPFDQDKIRKKIETNDLKRMHAYGWITEKGGRLVRNASKSIAGEAMATASWVLEVTQKPVVTNISKGQSDNTNDAIVAENNDSAREQQNFLQGTAQPNSNITVVKTEGDQRTIIGRTVTNEEGKWQLKVTENAGDLLNGGIQDTATNGTAKTLQSLGLTKGGAAKLEVIAQYGLAIASEPIQVTMDRVQTNAPTISYSTSAPLSKDANQLTGELGKQFQNTTKTVVTAYTKDIDGRLTELGNSGQVNGNIQGGQGFKIKLKSGALASCPMVVLKAKEGDFPKNLSAQVTEAKDDAYSESDEVEIPTCQQFAVTFDANQGNLGEVPPKVTVTENQPLGSKFPQTEPNRPGFEFKGWSTSQNAEVADFTASTPVDGTKTVYAVWKEIPVVDTDNDNIPDSADQCLNTPNGAKVDGEGCSVAPIVGGGQQVIGEVGAAIEPVSIPVTNEGKVEFTCEADGLPKGLTITRKGDACEVSGIPEESATNKPFTVSVIYPDPKRADAQKKITGTSNTSSIQSYAEQIEPKYEGVSVEAGKEGTVKAPTKLDETPLPEKTTFAKGTGDFPEWAHLNDQDGSITLSPEVTVPADTYQIPIVVKYPDGSTDTVNVPVTVTAAADADGDLVPDVKDHCEATPNGASVDENGCPVAPTVGGGKTIKGTIGTQINPVVIPVTNMGQVEYTCQAEGLPKGLEIGKVEGGCQITGTPTETVENKQIPVKVEYTNPESGKSDKITVVGGDNTFNISNKPDDDKDGIPNDADQCESTPASAQVDSEGCPVAPTVGDGQSIVGKVGTPIVPVTIPVTNNGNVDYVCHVDNLPAGLEVKKVVEGCQIFGTPDTPVKDGNVQVKVTYPNPRGGDTPAEVTGGNNPVNINSYADQITPKYEEAELPAGGSKEIAKPTKQDDEPLPDGTTFKPGAGVPEWAIVKEDGSITVTPGAEIEPGTYKVPVKVTYPDGSSEDIEVPVKVDAAPTEPDSDKDGVPDGVDLCSGTAEGAKVDPLTGCSVAPVVGEVTSIEGKVGSPIDPVVVPVTNEGKVDYQCKVENLPEGLKIEKTDAGCQISGTPTKPFDGKIKAVVSYPNPMDPSDSLDVSKEVPAAIKSYADQNDPVYKPVPVKAGESATIEAPKNADGSDLPGGTTFEKGEGDNVPDWATVNPDGSITVKPGKDVESGDYTVPVVVTYPDGTKDTVNVPVKVTVPKAPETPVTPGNPDEPGTPSTPVSPEQSGEGQGNQGSNNGTVQSEGQGAHSESQQDLARTGSSATVLLSMAGLLALAGAMLVTSKRRRS